MRRHLSPGGGGGRQANRRKSRAHHRDKRSWNRSRALSGQQEEEESPGRLNLGGLRAERRSSVSRRRQSRHGRDDERPLELCLLESDRRVSCARLLARKEIADRNRAALQHGRSTTN